MRVYHATKKIHRLFDEKALSKAYMTVMTLKYPYKLSEMVAVFPFIPTQYKENHPGNGKSKSIEELKWSTEYLKHPKGVINTSSKNISGTWT